MYIYFTYEICDFVDLTKILFYLNWSSTSNDATSLRFKLSLFRNGNLVYDKKSTNVLSSNQNDVTF